jgi:hypothetical protein
MTNQQRLVITKDASALWHVATPSSLTFGDGTSEMDVLVKCAKEGWALVSTTQGTAGAATYYFKQTPSDPVSDGLRPRIDLR